MAGLAWLRGEPVSTCDLATDATGDVRPGARAVAAQAAVAVPVFEGDGLRAKRGASDDERLAEGQSEARTLRAVVGIAFAGPTLPSLAVLTAAAAHLPPISGRD